MRRKLRIILPLLQVTVAAGLLILGHYQYHRIRGREYVFGEPATHLAHAISAPAHIIRVFAWILYNAIGLDRSEPAEDGFFLIGVGILWFAVGFELDSGHCKWQSPQQSLFSLKALIDVGAVIVGILCVLGAIGAWDRLHWYSAVEAAIDAAIYSVWGVLLIVIYGRDLLFRVLNWRRPVKDGAFPIE